MAQASPYGNLVRKAPLAARAQARTYFDSADWQLSKEQAGQHEQEDAARQAHQQCGGATTDGPQVVCWRTLVQAAQHHQQAIAHTPHGHVVPTPTGTMPLQRGQRRASRLGMATPVNVHVQG